MDVLSPSISSVILIDSSTGSLVHVLMLSIQAVRGLPRLYVHLVLFLALSLSPGNSHVSSWCDVMNTLLLIHKLLCSLVVGK